MIEITIRDRDHPTYHTKKQNFPTRVVAHKGHTFDVNGERLELFTVKVMAKACDRSVAVLTQWERDGNFPKPLFDVTGMGKARRWYSAFQIINVHRLAFYKYQFKKSRYSNNEAFWADVRKVFYKQSIVVDINGNITG